MENEIITKPDTTQVIDCDVQNTNDGQVQCYPLYEDERQSKLVDEVIATVKDARMNTKHALSADITSRALVQNQNDRVITECERELRRRDLPEERRAELFEIMREAAASTSAESAVSREFQKKQLERSQKLPWEIFGVLLFVCIGVAICRKKAD